LEHHFILQSIINQGVGAVVGALSRNLVDLQERQGSYLSIYDQPTTALKVCCFLRHFPYAKVIVFFF
jgi:hypothetical protein